MKDTFQYNGVTYQVTSALVPPPRACEAGVIYNFSMAILMNGRKQIALNSLSIVRRINFDTGKPFLQINSPRQKYMGGSCSSIVFFPNMEDELQNTNRRDFIATVYPIVEEMAKLNYQHRNDYYDD